jgi:hypothetical protein
MPARRPAPGWILTKYVGYASYTTGGSRAGISSSPPHPEDPRWPKAGPWGTACRLMPPAWCLVLRASASLLPCRCILISLTAGSRKVTPTVAGAILRSQDRYLRPDFEQSQWHCVPRSFPRDSKSHVLAEFEAAAVVDPVEPSERIEFYGVEAAPGTSTMDDLYHAPRFVPIFATSRPCSRFSGEASRSPPNARCVRPFFPEP